MKAYVDGSFDPENNMYGYGIVFVLSDGKTEKYAGCGSSPELLSLRNISGEILAAMYAVRIAVSKGIKDIEICHDYTGVSGWVTGAFKAKNPVTIQYKMAMNNWMNEIRISFTKVNAHSGDIYNDEADAIARMAILQKTCA